MSGEAGESPGANTAAAHRLLSLELNSIPGPISGVLTGVGELPVEFSGWIQLAELIESHRPGAAEASGEGPASG